MASNDQKTELFFKTFNNTVNADQGQTFVALDNKYPFRDYVFNTNIFSNNIPDNIADFSANYFGTTYYGIAALDLSNSGALGGTPQPLGISYELPGTNLKYFYKVELDFALTNNYQTWYIPTDDLSSNNSLLRDSIPFNYDAEFKSYFPALYDNSGNTAFGLYGNKIPWLIDYKSGFIQYYTTDNIVAETIFNNVPPTGTGGKPRFSFVKYIGPKGASGGGGGGGDASFNNIDISGDIILQDNNLMQSLTINGWIVPNTTTYYIIATVPESGANAFGYFTIQLQDAYYQQVSFYAGVMENKNSVIKVISNTNQDIAPLGYIGFKNLQIILYSSVYYLVTIFEPVPGTQSSLLKIILTNNNSNGKDQINLDRYWTLRNDPDTDWTQTGPQPPGPWTPALVGPQPNLPPAEVTVSLANTNAIFGGNPHGISTQPEYFQNDIVIGPSGNIVANDGTGTIDICGNFYVNLESDFNQDVFMRGTLDVSNNVNIGKNLTVDGSGNFGGTVTTVGNTTLVEYKHYDDSDFTTTTTLQWDTIAVSEHESGITDRASYAEFHLYDNTTNADSTILVFSVSKLITNYVTINVKEINWNTSSQCIEKIRIKFGSVVTNRRAEIQIYHKRISSSVNPTSIDIRMYTNLSKSDSITDILPWKLSSDNQSYSNNITELDLTNNNSNNNSSATNLYKYFDKGIMLGNDINLNSNNINNTSQIEGSNPSNYINFNNSSNLKINSNNILQLSTTNSTNDISYSNDIIDFQSTNKIENLSSINLLKGDITIGNPDNNILIDASQVEIRSKGGGPPFGDIILNNNGGGNGSIILRNGASYKGDIRFNASNLIGFDLSNNKLRVDEMEPSTSSSISFNNSNISDISNVTSAINFNAKTNMYTDTSGNITTNLTSTGDFGFDTSNKIWSYNEGGNKYILANNKRVWFSTSNLPISGYGGSPSGITQFNGGFKIIPSEIVNYSMYQDYRNGVGGITDDFTDFGVGFLKYIEVQNNGIIRGGGSKFNNIYITNAQVSPSQEEFFVKLNIKPSGGSWGTAQTLQTFEIPVTTVGIKDLNGDNFTSNISVNSGDLLRIELVFSPSGGAEFTFGQNTIGTATYPETSAGLIATGPRAMFWLDIIEYLPQLP